MIGTIISIISIIGMAIIVYKQYQEQERKFKYKKGHLNG